MVTPYETKFYSVLTCFTNGAHKGFEKFLSFKMFQTDFCHVGMSNVGVSSTYQLCVSSMLVCQ